ncbi:CPBP family intramembrane metalloprotease, partial [Staphylococcus aureus]|nr:CPBP family intramembrane metalloprotease [Staphylococcus aureus]
YLFYHRDIESNRLLKSICVGIITAIILIMIQLLFSLINSNLSYSSLIKELARTGFNWKWQMLVSLLFVIPCHEFYM